jgi:hypothetical protein
MNKIQSASDQEKLLSTIPKLVDDRQKKYLTATPSSKEIEEVVMDFEGDKSPRLDNFPMFFFKKMWHIMGENVSNAQ